MEENKESEGIEENSSRLIKKGNTMNILLKSCTIIMFLLSINLLTGSFGIYNPMVTRIAAFCLLVTIVFLNISVSHIQQILKSPRKHPWKDIGAGFLLLLLSILFLFSFSLREVWLLQLPLFFIGLDLLLQGMHNKKNELFVFVVMSFFYGFFIVILQNIPVLFNSVQQFSLFISKSIGSVSQPVLLGASASGLWILLSFLFYLATAFIFSEKRRNKRYRKLFWLCLLALFIGWIFYILFQSVSQFDTVMDRMNSTYILFIINAIVLIPFVLKIEMKMVSFHVPKFKDLRVLKRKEKWAVAIICLFLLLSGLFLTMYTPGSTADEKRNIAFYLPGTTVGEFDLPEYGKYGEQASGFFGLLPQYLQSFGYNVELINETLTSTNLERNDVVVFINLGETFSDDNLTLIWNYVNNGGALLVLGDHTDIGGIMHPLNNLLEPVGIRYRFDSAVFVKDHWESCIAFLHHPTTEGVVDADEVGVSIGASLDIDITKSAFPIILGKGGFSDTGSYHTPGSFLGDYSLNPGEQLGDVILAAGAYHGQGRVVVFGDTSSFQNVGLSKNSRLIMNIFAWLTSTHTALSYHLQMIAGLIFFCVAIFLVRTLKSKFLLIFPIIFCVGLMTTSVVNPLIFQEQVPTGPICYIDISHGERINKAYYKDDSVSGVVVNLLRNEYIEGQRYLPLILKEFSKEKISHSKILVLIAPTAPFTNDEVDIIEHFVSQGGLLILSVGYIDKEGSSLLLETFDFDILSIPLGPVPYIEYSQSEPRFVDSWPISLNGLLTNDSTILYSAEFNETSYSLIVFRKYGLGGVLLISDSQFLLDKNLESLYDYWPGNINLLRSIIAEIKTKGVPQ